MCSSYANKYSYKLPQFRAEFKSNDKNYFGSWPSHYFKTPLADDVELYILEKDGSLTPYPLSKLDKYNYAFYLPKEINSYTFMIKAIFETYIGGIAYYPVNFNLR